MKKRKVLISLLCATALLGVSTGVLSSCKKAEEPENPTPEVQKFEVNFNSMGGSDVAKIENIESGSKITKPEDPTKADSTFAGWYKDNNCTQAWNFETDTVTESLTLYAKWTAEVKVEKVKVTFNSNGGSDVEQVEINKNTKITKPEDPTKTDYDFVGWYKTNPETNSNAVAWDFETDTVSGDITLYAKWEKAVKYIATLVYNNDKDDDGELVAVKDATDGKYYFDEPAKPKKDYHIFEGWYTDVDCTEAYLFSTEVKGNITLYAKFNPAYDKVNSIFNFIEAAQMIQPGATSGDVSIPSTKTFGKFTVYGNGKSKFELSKNDINTQGATIEFKLTALNNKNTITLEGEWASSSKGNFSIINDADPAHPIYEKKDIEGSGTPLYDGDNLILSNLPSGTYKITSTKAIRITALSITEELKQGPAVSITVNKAGAKVRYLAGDKLSLAGLIVNLNYKNGRQDILDEEVISVSEVDMSTKGKKTVNISYRWRPDIDPFEASYEIEVFEVEELVLYNHILDNSRITKNVQTIFNVEDKFNDDYLTVKAKCALTKANETDPQEYIEFILSSSQYTLDKPDMSTAGEKTVTIKFNNDTSIVAEYKVQVVDVNDYTADTLTMTVDPAAAIDTTTEGKYNFHTINQALQFIKLVNTPDETVKNIYLKKNTTYFEKIEIDVPNVNIMTGESTTNGFVLVDDAAQVAVISFDGINGALDPSESITYSTNGSATLSIRKGADNFIAKNIKVQNYYNTLALYQESLKKYGDGFTQAVAVLVEGDKVSFINCILSSYHDTLYAKSGRQYYEHCFIEGHTDYIFGNDATAYFYYSDIHSLGNDDLKNGGYIVASKGNAKVDAAGNITDNIKYGYIFDTCQFTADAKVVAGTTSMARSWGEGMTIMVMNSTIGGHVSTEAYGDTTSEKNDRYGSMKSGDKIIEPTASQLLEYGNGGDGKILESLANTCTVVTDASDYDSLVEIFTPNNGTTVYGDVWAGPKAAKDATITLLNKDGSTYQTLENVSYIGSVITESMLTNLINIPKDKDNAGFYTDSSLQTEYDFSTKLEANNNIYVDIYDISYENHTLDIPYASINQETGMPKGTSFSVETALTENNEQKSSIFYATNGVKTEDVKNGPDKHVYYGEGEGKKEFGTLQISLTTGKAEVSGETTKNAIKLVLDKKAKITIYCGQKSDKNVNLVLFDSDGKSVVPLGLTLNDEKVSEFGLLSKTDQADKYEFVLEAGTYYIGGSGGGAYIYGIEVACYLPRENN